MNEKKAQTEQTNVQQTETEFEYSWSSQMAQSLSRPNYMHQYLLDKVIMGVSVALCTLAVNKGIRHFKGAKNLVNSQLYDANSASGPFQQVKTGKN